jgi:hypothetical protein
MFGQLQLSNETSSVQAIKTLSTKLSGFKSTENVATNKSEVYDEIKIKNYFQLKSHQFIPYLFISDLFNSLKPSGN